MRHRRVSGWTTLTLTLTAPVLVAATFWALQPLDGRPDALRWVLLADMIYILFVMALVIGRIARTVAARRAQSAGSRLHMRLTASFAIVAMVPAVLVALFAMLTVNFALEGWFSNRISSAIAASQAAALAYKSEQTSGLVVDTRRLAWALTFRRRSNYMDDGELRVVLGTLEQQLQRPVKEIFIINNLGELRVRGP
ncbi:MAG: PAS domain-containing sensor histidine kinase, partial [Pseudomonadota bacterium]